MKKLLFVKCCSKDLISPFEDLIDKKIRTLPRQLPQLIYFLSVRSPYIKQLIRTELDWLSKIVSKDIHLVLRRIIFACSENIQIDTISKVRVAKRRTSLIILLADFGKVFELSEVTTALSVFADSILELLMDLYTYNEFQRMNYATFFLVSENYPKKIFKSARCAGLVSLGMGKLGSFELNYSSDIDLIFLFDEEKFKPAYYSRMRNAFIIIVRKIVKTLSEISSDGFVFRVDLRLRPDPSSNPVCIGVLAAQRYYENFGRNWERAAFIKARSIAGDKQLGRKFLTSLNSFIWRKNLDFAAIEDINDIRRKIRKKNWKALNRNLLGYNIKTGLGGIREIEFFVQTQQLIRGGKAVALRVPSTVKALQALKIGRLISEQVYKKLVSHYEQLRMLEHILQVIEDSQTHSLPNDYKKVQNVALLSGFSDTNDFLDTLFKLLIDVDSIIKGLYSRFDPLDEQSFANKPVKKSEDVFTLHYEKWLSYRAFRSERSLKLFDDILPLITARILKTENANNTLFYFDKFLNSLSFGVQTLSLFKANPAVLDLLIDICGTAPALAEYVGRNPSVLDVVTDHSFFLPLSTKDELTAEFVTGVCEANDYEGVLDYARLFAKENQFRTGVHLLKAFSSISDITQSFSNIAEVCLVNLFKKVHTMFSQRYGNISGLGPSLLAMGKLGSEEMSMGSDLDLILIYHANEDVNSDGQYSVPAQVYYSRLTQAFISAITVATAEGYLFKVDMRLRPSGNKGTVATSIESFKNYQVNEAWVWERLALSRGRVLNGNLILKGKIKKIIVAALHSQLSPLQVQKEVKEMRLRINKKIKKFNYWENFKYGSGRLQDLELLLQMGALLKKQFKAQAPKKMISELKYSGFLTDEEALVCESAYSFYFFLGQILNITVTGQIGKDSLKSLYSISKSHNFVGLQDDLDVNLKRFTKSIDTIFTQKLIYV